MDLSPSLGERRLGQASLRPSAVRRWPSTETCGYVNLLRNFAAVIRDGAKQDVKWEEVIEITELAHQSSRERRTLEVPRLMILVLGGGNYVAG